MGIDTHVSSCSRQTFTFSVRYMLLGFWITIQFRHSVINHEHHIGIFGSWTTNEKVIWFDISVNQVSFMDTLYTIDLYGCKSELSVRCHGYQKTWIQYHLFGEHGHSLYGMLSSTHVK